MDRRQLQIFQQVAVLANFTRAAEALHMAQPAVSIAIKKLEQELGVPLFNRVDRRISLTEPGRTLLRRAEKILAEFKLAKDELKDLEALSTGQVRFDTPAMLGSYYFPEKIAAFRRAFPGIHLHVTAEGTQRAEEMLIDGSIDMAVVNVGAHSSLIESRYLVKEEVVVCAAKDHPLTKVSEVDSSLLQAYPLIVYHQGYHLRQILNQLAAAADGQVEIVLETDILRLMVEMLTRGEGVGICLRRLVEVEKGLCAIPFRKPEYIELGIGWKKGAYLSRANQALVDFLTS